MRTSTFLRATSENNTFFGLANFVISREGRRVQHQLISATHVKSTTNRDVFDEGLSQSSSTSREHNSCTRTIRSEHEILSVTLEIRSPNLEVHTAHVSKSRNESRITIKHALVREIGVTSK